MKPFSRNLIAWYDKNARELPWRNSSNPYSIWVSEIILQQTRVVQGLQYYDNFLSNFPSVEDLANAPEAKVLKVWQGLGYYSRARNMQYAARQVLQEFDGNFPDNYADILKLKGIGKYTAAAIASIAFREAVPAVDGNVKRVMARYLALHQPLDNLSMENEIRQWLQKEIPSQRAGDFNQAMMELGALVCTPQNPSCDRCPLQAKCAAHAAGLQAQLPVKAVKVKPVALFLEFAFLEMKGKTVIIKRDNSGIWAGLYEFPNVEVQALSQDANPVEIFKDLFKDPKSPVFTRVFEAKHQLTHRTIFARFWHIHTSATNIVKNTAIQLISLQSLPEFPVHRLMQRFLESVDLNVKKHD